MRPSDHEKLERLAELLQKRELPPMTNYSPWFGFLYTLKWCGMAVAYLVGLAMLVYLLSRL